MNRQPCIKIEGITYLVDIDNDQLIHFDNQKEIIKIKDLPADQSRMINTFYKKEGDQS